MTFTTQGQEPAQAADVAQKVSQESITKTAMKFIDTPYRHQGRLPGLDCIGLPIVVCDALGIGDLNDYPKNYPRVPDGRLKPTLKRYCSFLPRISNGSILLFNIGGVPAHCGIAIWDEEWYMIHAYQNVGAVKKHRLIKWWDQKLDSVYAFPGVHYVTD